MMQGPSSQQPPQQPPQQPYQQPYQQPAAQPPAKKGGCGKFALGCLGVFVLLGVIGSFLPKTPSTGSSSTSSAASSSSSSSNDTAAPEPTPSAIKVSASSLYSAYNANEVAADNKYKDKQVIVSGTVDSIGKDITDTMYITLKGDGVINTVQCMFGDEYKSQLASISKGQKATIQGECAGKSLLSVLLRDSKLVK